MAITAQVVLRFSGAQVARGLAAVQRGFANVARAGISAFSSLISSATRLAAVLGPIAAFAGFGKMVTGSVNAAASIEDLTAMYSTLLGSQAEGKRLMEGIIKLNEQSRLGLDDMASGASKFLAQGMKIEDVIKTLDMLGKVTMGDADKFKRLSEQYSQVMGKGKFQAEERMAFTEAGWDPIAELEKMTGKSKAAFFKMMEAGQITFEMIQEAMVNATTGAGRFTKVNEDMSKTTTGKWMIMLDTWERLKIAMGTPINDHLRPLLDQATAKLGTMGEKFKEIGEQIGRIITAITNAYQNGELGALLKEGIEVVWDQAIARLVAAFVTGADYMGTVIKNAIRGDDPAEEGFQKGFRPDFKTFGPFLIPATYRDKKPSSYAENLEIAQAGMGTKESKKALMDRLESNQSVHAKGPLPMASAADYQLMLQEMRAAKEALLGTKKAVESIVPKLNYNY
jgi:tape measure domain-containing protein